MKKLRNILLYPIVLLVCLATGLWAGPLFRAGYAHVFPEPEFTQGDFSAIYRETGKPVVMFSTSTCPYCRRARALLDDEHIAYQDFVIDQSSQARQRFALFGGSGVPVLLIGSRRIEGFREDTIRDSLAQISQSRPREVSP